MSSGSTAAEDARRGSSSSAFEGLASTCAHAVDFAEITSRVEAVSDTYARNFGIGRDAAWYLLKLQEEVGGLTQAYLMRQGQARNNGLSAQQLDEAFRGEIADVPCHVLLLAKHHDVDVLAAVAAKWLRWGFQHTERGPRGSRRASQGEQMGMTASPWRSATALHLDR